MRFGIIGIGNMGNALLTGALNSGISADSIGITSLHASHWEDIAASRNVIGFASGKELTEWADILFLCVKPQVLPSVLEEIKPFAAGKAFVSVAAGLPLSYLKEALPESRILRIMPNTPVKIGKGVICVNTPHEFQTDEYEAFSSFVSQCGTVVPISEHLFDAVTGLSGSGPAYVYTFAEALTEAGVMQGIPYALARELAVQTVIGSAEMLKSDPKKAFSDQKAEVTSPGGTTIAGLFELEKNGFKSAVMQAVDAATRRSKELSK